MKNYDPLVANGITYAPIKDIVLTDMPVICNTPYIPVYPQYKPDVYTPSMPSKKEGFSWGKFLLGTAAIAATLFGIKKYGGKIATAIKNKLTWTNIKNTVNNCYTNVKNRIANFFTKKP